MANELQYYGDPATETGFTVTARIYDDTGTQVGGDVSAPEIGVLAIYIADMPSAPAGHYHVRFFSGVTLLGTGVLYWDGTAEITLQTLSAEITALETNLTIAIEDGALLVR